MEQTLSQDDAKAMMQVEQVESPNNAQDRQAVKNALSGGACLNSNSTCANYLVSPTSLDNQNAQGTGYPQPQKFTIQEQNVQNINATESNKDVADPNPDQTNEKMVVQEVDMTGVRSQKSQNEIQSQIQKNCSQYRPETIIEEETNSQMGVPVTHQMEAGAEHRLEDFQDSQNNQNQEFGAKFGTILGFEEALMCLEPKQNIPHPCPKKTLQFGPKKLMGYLTNPVSHHYAEQKKIRYTEFDTRKEMAQKMKEALRQKIREESHSPSHMSMDQTASGYTSAAGQDKSKSQQSRRVLSLRRQINTQRITGSKEQAQKSRGISPSNEGGRAVATNLQSETTQSNLGGHITSALSDFSTLNVNQNQDTSYPSKNLIVGSKNRTGQNTHGCATTTKNTQSSANVIIGSTTIQERNSNLPNNNLLLDTVGGDENQLPQRRGPIRRPITSHVGGHQTRQQLKSAHKASTNQETVAPRRQINIKSNSSAIVLDQTTEHGRKSQMMRNHSNEENTRTAATLGTEVKAQPEMPNARQYLRSAKNGATSGHPLTQYYEQARTTINHTMKRDKQSMWIAQHQVRNGDWIDNSNQYNNSVNNTITGVPGSRKKGQAVSLARPGTSTAISNNTANATVLYTKRTSRPNLSCKLLLKLQQGKSQTRF